MNFNYELITQPNTVVHCRTKEQARALLRFMHDKGMKWFSGASLKETKYNRYNADTSYNFNEGRSVSYTSIHFYYNTRYKILSFEEALKENTMELHASEILKADGDATMAVSIKALQKLINTIDFQQKAIAEQNAMIEEKDTQIERYDNIVKDYEDKFVKMQAEIDQLKNTSFAMRGVVTDIKF